MKKIIENGAVISEYPPATQRKSEYFPKRNKIISALSNKIFVAEAGEKSIIKALKIKPLTVDELVLMLRVTRNGLINILFSMELSNTVKVIGGKYAI